ncbi:hypothetical protein E4O00_13055 [Treponema sp. OMZ 788]|uniref:hypothetical protein n=1 Tax=Treponema sp. OMZ 788 TaxID=2563664 RepID=UPI0020A5DF46|nr:hypothetical protein [Treponema sp. OMZ 788]UTC64655.1 hypothetical protein E4O00_13055 [Treponema sp. OMZ 788]
MKTKRYIFILFSVIFIFFASCNNTPIFSVIENEISLKKFSVEGNVLGLIEKDNNVYVANRAGVYVKNKNDEANWKEILTADRGIQKIASNSDNVFVCFESGNVKYYEAGNWKDVPGSGNIRIIAGDNIVFGYDESQEKVFKIVKNAAPSEVIHSGKVDSLFAAGNYVVVKSGSSETMYKADTSSAAVVAGLPGGVKGMCSAGDAGKIFVLAGSSIHYYNGSSWSDKTISISGKNHHNISYVPLSISYFKERRTILVGCQNGYTEVKLDDTDLTNLSKAKQVNPGEDGSTTPPGSASQYQTTLGGYHSDPILGISKGGSDYAVFLGISSGIIQRNTGLWGFYSDKREWNRE